MEVAETARHSPRTTVLQSRAIVFREHSTIARHAFHSWQNGTILFAFFFDVQASVCNRTPIVCENVCVRDPWACYPIYDPWWWLMCPACGSIWIYVDPGEEFQNITVYNTLGEEIGPLERLREPVVEGGERYTYAIQVRKIQENVGYALRANVAGRKLRTIFSPKYLVKIEKSETR